MILAFVGKFEQNLIRDLTILAFHRHLKL